MPRLSLRFEHMSERHAELAWRFGEPDECVEGGEGEEGQRAAAWVLRSPLPVGTGVAGHLEWASECLRPHEAFVGELISLGGRVVLRVECASEATDASFQINARVLLPMAHAGVRIDWVVG